MNIKGILTIVVASMVGCPVTSQPNGGVQGSNCTMVRLCNWISDEPLNRFSEFCKSVDDPDACCNNSCSSLNCANVQACFSHRVTHRGTENIATRSCSAKHPPGDEFIACCTDLCSK
uniref:Cysteine-rich protein n=1 Tax=Hyaloperonospora arabidopsidis TaxID=272952 RepID=F6MEX9_HYAAB|nr:cysteine-rich protein [Hyaloperonospora arabidopsidis]